MKCRSEWQSPQAAVRMRTSCGPQSAICTVSIDSGWPKETPPAAQGGGSVALQFDGEKTVLKIVPLSSVAAKTRHMPDDYLDVSGTSLSEKGMAYMKRLVPKKYDVGKPFV